MSPLKPGTAALSPATIAGASQSHGTWTKRSELSGEQSGETRHNGNV
jgi:hypothetical protein